MAGSGDTLAGNEESSEERAVPRGATKGAGSRRFRTVALALVVVATSVAMIIVALSLRPPLTTIRVAGGLDFDNAEVQEILDAKGIRVQRTSVGSRSLTTLAELQEYDAIIPGGRIAADQVATTLGATTDQVNTYDAFFSPMVVVTYDPIIRLLQSVGTAPMGKDAKQPQPLARQNPDGTWLLNVAAYLHEVKQKRHWTDIPGNTRYENFNRMLITTTNPDRSNSAAMFVAISSAAANDGSVVETEAAADAAATEIKACFDAQGKTWDKTQWRFFRAFRLVGVSGGAG